MLSAEAKARLNVAHGVVRFFRVYQAPWLDFLSQQGWQYLATTFAIVAGSQENGSCCCRSYSRF